MQIRNGQECDQICRPWHARDRLINHLLLMGFFVHRIQIIDCDPKAISSFVSSIPIFSLFSPQFMSSIFWIYITMKWIAFSNHKKIIPLACKIWITLICWVDYSFWLIIHIHHTHNGIFIALFLDMINIRFMYSCFMLVSSPSIIG